MSRAICVSACPDWMRRAHASGDFMWAKSFGIVRVPGVPIAWQPMQPLVFTTFSHSPWCGTLPTGNSLFAGILSIEYQ